MLRGLVCVILWYWLVIVRDVLRGGGMGEEGRGVRCSKKKLQLPLAFVIKALPCNHVMLIINITFPLKNQEA